MGKHSSSKFYVRYYSAQMRWCGGKSIVISVEILIRFFVEASSIWILLSVFTELCGVIEF